MNALLGLLTLLALLLLAGPSDAGTFDTPDLEYTVSTSKPGVFGRVLKPTSSLLSLPVAPPQPASSASNSVPIPRSLNSLFPK